MDLHVSWQDALIAVGLFAASTLVTTIIVGTLLVLIPADHFIAPSSGLKRRLGSPVLRVGYRIAKNALGVVLIIAGVLLSVPGVPGQGLLTILVGVILLDVPGKRGLELKLISRPRVLRGINRLRRRFGRPPVLTATAKKDRGPPIEVDDEHSA